MVIVFSITDFFRTAENSRKGTFVSCVCKAMVERILTDQDFTQFKTSENICPGLPIPYSRLYSLYNL